MCLDSHRDPLLSKFLVIGRTQCSFLLLVPRYYWQPWDVKTCRLQRIHILSTTQQITSQETRWCSSTIFGALGKSHCLSGRKQLVKPLTSAVLYAHGKPSWIDLMTSSFALPSPSKCPLGCVSGAMHFLSQALRP